MDHRCVSFGRNHNDLSGHNVLAHFSDGLGHRIGRYFYAQTFQPPQTQPPVRGFRHHDGHRNRDTDLPSVLIWICPTILFRHSDRTDLAGTVRHHGHVVALFGR